VDLSDFGVSLETAKEYRWVVALVPDPNRRSRDVITEGRVMRVKPSPELQRELTAASDGGAHDIYARHGMWYDAVHAAGVRIAENSEDASCRRWLADMLLEVDLAEPAAALLAPEDGGSGHRTATSYVPMRRGAPSRVVSAASRAGTDVAGAAAASPASIGGVSAKAVGGPAIGPVVLTPAEGMETIREQPTLFWYTAEAPSTPFCLCVTRQDAAEPLC